MSGHDYDFFRSMLASVPAEGRMGGKKSKPKAAPYPVAKKAPKKQARQRRHASSRDVDSTASKYRDRAAERRKAEQGDEPNEGNDAYKPLQLSAMQQGSQAEAAIASGIDFGLVEQTRQQLAYERSKSSASEEKAARRPPPQRLAPKSHIAASILHLLQSDDALLPTGGISARRYAHLVPRLPESAAALDDQDRADMESLAAAVDLPVVPPLQDPALLSAYCSELRAATPELPAELSQPSLLAAVQQRRDLALHRSAMSSSGAGAPSGGSQLHFLPWRTSYSFKLTSPSQAGRAAAAAFRAGRSAAKREAASSSGATAAAASGAAAAPEAEARILHGASMQAALAALPRVTRRAAEDCPSTDDLIGCRLPEGLRLLLKETCEAAGQGEEGLRRLRRRRKRAREQAREQGRADTAERRRSEGVGGGSGTSSRAGGTVGFGEERAVVFGEGGTGGEGAIGGTGGGGAIGRAAVAGASTAAVSAPDGSGSGSTGGGTTASASRALPPRGILRNKGEKTPVGPGGVSRGLSLELDADAATGKQPQVTGAAGSSTYAAGGPLFSGSSAAASKGEEDDDDEDEDIFADAGDYDTTAVLEEAARRSYSQAQAAVGGDAAGRESQSAAGHPMASSASSSASTAGAAVSSSSTAGVVTARRRGWFAGPEGGLEAQLDLIDTEDGGADGDRMTSSGGATDGAAFRLKGLSSVGVGEEMGVAEEDLGAGLGEAYDSDEEKSGGKGAAAAAGAGEGSGSQGGAVARAKEEAKQAKKRERQLDRQVVQIEAIMKRKREAGEEVGKLPSAPGAKKPRIG